MTSLRGKIKFAKAKISRIVLAVLALIFFVLLPTDFARADVTDFISSIASGIIGGAAKGFTAIIMGILSPIFLLINFVLGTILYISGWVFNWALELSIKYDSTVESFVAVGWETSLQFANLFFIILLLAIAIATILELGNFNYKKALPRFLMVALLINFSMVIGGVVLDATNVFAKFFSDSIAKSSMDTAALVMHALGVNEIKNADQASLTNLGNTLANFGDIFGLLFYQIFFQAIAIFVLLSGAVYMISRAFWIWLLLMIAPLAWIAYAFPEGSTIHSQWKKWWEQYLCWCIFAPAYLFFTYLALVISGTTFANMVTNKTLDAYNAGALIQIAVVGFLMTSGLFIGKKIGCGGGNFVINYGNNLKGAASKRFKELRSKGPLSAEKLGERFGGLGARGLAAVPGVGRLAGYRPAEVRGRLELERQKQQQEALDQEKLRLSGQLAGMDEDQRRQYLLTQTQSARNGTGPTSLAQVSAINMLMEDKIAMEDLSEQQQFYMRRAQAAATASRQRDNIQVDYIPQRQVSRAIERDVSSTIDKWKKLDSYTYPDGHPRAGTTVNYGSMDIQSLMSMVDNDILNGNTGADTAIALAVLNDRVDEAIPHIPGANTPRDIARIKAEYRRYEKIGQRSAALGATSAAYI